MKELQNKLTFKENGKFEVEHLGIKYNINASEYLDIDDIETLNDLRDYDKLLINQIDYPIKATIVKNNPKRNS